MTTLNAENDFLIAGSKIMAVKAYRARTDQGLREAKVAMDKREYDLGMMGYLRLKGQNDLDKLDVKGDFARLQEAAKVLAFLVSDYPDRASRLRQINEVANNLRSLSDYYRSLV